MLDYLQLLWFRKKMIIAITLFAAVIGYIQVSEIRNVYSATATMLNFLPVLTRSVIARATCSTE